MNYRHLSFLKYISCSQSQADGMRLGVALAGPIFIFESWMISNSSPSENWFTLFFIGVIFFLIGFFSIYFNYQKVKMVYNNGIEIPGKIWNIYFHFGYGLITCEYRYEGQIYRSSHQVSRFGKARKAKVGQDVILIMDRKKHQQVLIRDFYQ